MLRRLPVASTLFVAVLTVMAAAQASDVPGFVDALRTFDLALDARVAAVLAIVGEAGAAVALVLALHARPELAATAGVAGQLVAAAWTAVVAQALARGLDVPNCGWLGAHLGHELRWWALGECAALLALAAWSWRQARRRAARALASAV